MTNTEHIANAVYDKHVDLSPEAVTLGNMASELELWAASSETPYWEKPQLLARAQMYRVQQFEMIQAMPVGPSAVETHANAIAMIDAEIEARREALRLEKKYVADPSGELSKFTWSREHWANAGRLLLSILVYAAFVLGTVLTAHWAWTWIGGK